MMNQNQPHRHPVKSHGRFQRAAAVRIVSRVLGENVPLDEALSQVMSELSLEASAVPSTRAWLQDVCSGTLRWRGRLDQIIDSVALKKKPSGWLRKILLVAIYQLIAQDRVQPGAVVSETVNEIKRKEGYAPSRFANAVLRKIADHAAEYRSAAFPENPDEQASWASLPEWMWKRLVAQQGADWVKSFALSCLDRPVIWIRSKTPMSWAALEGSVPGSYQVTEGGSIAKRTGFLEGDFFVQDISSQFLIHEIGVEVRKSLGDGALTALDLCAAPGGKTAGLSWNGFQVTATDRAEQASARFALLDQTIKRVCPTARLISRDEVSGLPEQDLVWVDAPCSGSGIIRRHPDVRWLRREGELPKLQESQARLVTEAWGKVKPGGYLVYSVCSLLREEGPEVLSQAGFSGHVVREWILGPQASPYGDGFYGALLHK